MGKSNDLKCSTCGDPGDCGGTIDKCVNCYEVEKRLAGYLRSKNGRNFLVVALDANPDPDVVQAAKPLVERYEVALATEGANDDMLDDLVHDLASDLASDVNNGGPGSQVTYILEQLGVDAGVQQISEILDEGIAVDGGEE